MGLFFSSDRFTRPGPGVRPDAPRKKGVARLAEIMGRDMWNFFRAGFLAFLGCLPFIIGMFFAVHAAGRYHRRPDCRPGAERHG